ncbi:MAG: hypothetical protein ACJ739_09305 [Acidimicrobiales bacterium]
MLGTTVTQAIHSSAGCWRHGAVVGEQCCDRCGVRCCEHCWVETRRAALCIECALELGGVRAPRKRRRRDRPPTSERSPLAAMSWERSAGLIDLGPALRRRRPEPVPRQLFVRAA